MPLFYQHNIDAHTHIGVWRIEEEEAFFMRSVSAQKEISHPYKRLQHLAGRYLLTVLAPDLPHSSLEITKEGKPVLTEGDFQLSISHCGNFAAAIVSNKKPVGIDVELETPRLQAIAPKFLDEIERSFLSDWGDFPHMHLQLLTMLWSAKEAVFKWYGKGQVDFRQHIHLCDAITGYPDGAYTLPFVFRKEGEQRLDVHARIFEPLILAWVIG
jgi:phosphopantetheinyl transferase